MILSIILIIIIIFIFKMNVDIAETPVPYDQILGLTLASNSGRSCAHPHCCGSTVTVELGSVALYFSVCTGSVGRDSSRTRGRYPGDHGL